MLLRIESAARLRPPRVQRRADDEFVLGKHPLDARGLAALQRSVGNRAVAGALAARQGMDEVVDEAPLVAGQRLGVQRVATWANGTVHETNNLANTVINGAPVGATAPVVNGTITRNSAAVGSALAAPTVTVTTPASGGFDAEINTVPTNTGSFDETVLSAGPWRIDTTQAIFHTMFPTVAGCTGAGATRFRAFGDPSDASMQAANRRHEDHHASDMQAAFNDIVVPWDQKVTAAKAAATKFHGASAAAAEAALWTAMGGTATQIADAFVARVVSDGAAFHATARGGNVRFSTTKNPGARSNCTISWAYLTNPS